MHDVFQATVSQNEDGQLVMEIQDDEEKQAESPVMEQGLLECTFPGCTYTTRRKMNWYKHKKQHEGE